MLTNNSKIVSNGDMSLASVHSTIISLDQVYISGIQAVWTGTPTGTIIIEVSCDPPADGNNNVSVTNWSDLSGSDLALTGSAGSYFWNLGNIGAQWARLTYTRTGSTGTLNARRVTKGY